MFLLTAFMLIFIPGCWDHVEIEELAIVRSISVDYIPGERAPYFVTLAVIRPGEMAGGGEGGGGGGGSPTRLYSGTGASLDLAVQEATFSLTRQLFLAHNEVVLIGEEAARQGIYHIMDFILRNAQLRLTNSIVIIPGTAHKILTQTELLETGISEEILGLIAQEEQTSEAVTQEMFVMLRDMSTPGQDTFTAVLHVGPQPKKVIPEIEVEEREDGGGGAGGESGGAEASEAEPPEILTLSGLAVFRGDKLAGFLNHVETRGFIWLNGEPSRSIIAVPDPMDPTKIVNISIIRSQTTVTPEIKDGNVSFRVEVVAEGDLIAQSSLYNLSTPAMLKKLGSSTSAVIKMEMEKTLQVLQGMEADIMGYGASVYRKDPKAFQELSPWSETFRDVTVDIHVTAQIRRTGQLSRPVQLKR